MKITDLEKKEILKYISLFPFTENIKNKTFLVTGAGGMTGQAVIKWLLLENEINGTHAFVYASTRNPQKGLAYLDETDSVILCEFGKEKEAIGEKQVDYIIHGAAPTARTFFMEHPVETFDIIANETLRLLKLAQEKEHCRFLYLSSMDVYGTPHSEEPVAESYVGTIDPLNIRNAYPVGKRSGEFLCNAFEKEYGVDTVIVRPASIQGLFQPYEEPRVFNEILRCLAEKRNLVLKSDGTVRKCFLYTLDAVSAIFTVLFYGKRGEAYNVTNPETFRPLKDIAEHLFRQFSPTNKVVFEIQKESVTGYLPSFSFVQSNEKICALGWKPVCSMDEIYEIDLKRFSGGDKEMSV